MNPGVLMYETCPFITRTEHLFITTQTPTKKKKRGDTRR